MTRDSAFVGTCWCSAVCQATLNTPIPTPDANAVTASAAGWGASASTASSGAYPKSPNTPTSSGRAGSNRIITPEPTRRPVVVIASTTPHQPRPNVSSAITGPSVTHAPA
ncbi:hypothetical protein [Saccharothrix deserti]|uniref:hypothetical protein n=1 Tax=Saccharothrix deserti TaxID=2593674 RepID=UPI00131B7D23|nr:hypothetical protein [Saccharothrix deserti]